MSPETCACAIESDVDSLPEFIRITEPCARKEHVCGECGELIMPGQKYVKEVGSWDGELGTHKTCMDCKSVRDTYFCSYTYGEIWEDMHNLLQETEGVTSPACLDKLTPGAKEKVLGIIKEIRREIHESTDERETDE